MKVYLDDERATPEGWHRVYTVGEVIVLLKTKQVKELSLDNDLGIGQPEGWIVLDWLEQTIFDDATFPIPTVTIHSSNPTRVEHMKRALQSIERIRQQQIAGA
jgi:hypothetical protein